MNTNDLKIFESVALSGNFTKAAQAMHTVQSNVTARIKSLEEEFGASLFLRSSRKVELTAAGEILMHYCTRINQLIDEAKNNIQHTDRMIGHLNIGCIETTMALKMPDIIAAFAEQYPDVDLEFRSAMRPTLISDVLNYKLNAAFVPAPVSIKDLDQVHIKEEQLVILVSSKYTNVQEVLSNKQLKIVVFEQGCVFRARLESWLDSKGILQYKSIVLNSIEGIINFVEAGIGISMLPAELIADYYTSRRLKTFSLNKELGTMNTVLVFRRNAPLSGPLNAFIRMYKQSASRPLPV
jgi:LysR family transcriptional regulator, cell division regulator